MRSLLLSFLFLLAVAATVSNISNEVMSKEDKEWRDHAVSKLWEERKNMGHTPLYRIEGAQMPGFPMVDMYIKNETATESGTLKHRFVWALILWAVTEGKIKSNTSVYDSTSGNTGSSEAYMCRLIGVDYTAVIADNLEKEKQAQIERFGGHLYPVPVDQRNRIAAELAHNNSGFFINQFGNADSAEEYHESGEYGKETTNVFHEIVKQLNESSKPPPNYFIHSAGTGGTISSVGKYISRYSIPTKVVLADSQFSLFYDYVLSNNYTNVSAGQPGRPDWVKPGIAGIGYGYNTEPIIFQNTTSLLRTVIDEVVRMPDMATVAAMRSLRALNIDGGASTALNFLVALYKAIVHSEGRDKIPDNQRISMVFIMGDPGSYYKSTYYNDSYVDENMAHLGGMKALNCWKAKIDDAIATGTNFIRNATACDI